MRVHRNVSDSNISGPRSPSTTHRSYRLAALGAVVLFCLIFSAGASAQNLFATLEKRTLPLDDDATHAVALADVDQDGDLDILLVNTGAQNRLYLNDGLGRFYDVTSSRLPGLVDVSRDVAAGDVDGDGDVDFLVANHGQNRLYLNDGSGMFNDVASTHLPADTDSTESVVLGDVDGDGDLDVVLGNDGTQDRLYQNDGNGIFIDITPTSLPVDTNQTQAVALGDFDGDGDLDLISTNSAQPRLATNDGLGHFTDVTATQLPGSGVSFLVDIAVGDVDGDNDLDLVLGGIPSTKLYLNNGAGAFTDGTAGGLPTFFGGTGAVLLADVDLDGDLDLLLGNGGQRNLLYANDGTGTFSDLSAVGVLPGFVEYTESLAIGDVDGDGDGDLFIGNNGQCRLHRGDGTGMFTTDSTPRLPASAEETHVIVSGDIDGDGDLDLIAGSRCTNGPTAPAGEQNRVYLNDGRGSYIDVTATFLPPFLDTTFDLALQDVDGDGDLDLVVGNQGQDRLYLNNGAGIFSDVTATQLPANAQLSTGLVFGDVDGDGDLDLAISSVSASGFGGSQNLLYLNDGTGSFSDSTASSLPPASNHTNALAFGDVDGDGDLDLVTGNEAQTGGILGACCEQNRLYLNNGGGGFVDATSLLLPVDMARTLCLALLDVDGDNDLDLFVGNDGQDFLYLNNGSGLFTDVTASRLPILLESTQSIAAGDFDLDGDLDLVVTANGRFYENDGSGSFTLVASGNGVTSGSSALAADIDGDADLDLVFSSYVGNTVRVNLARQIDAPYLLRPGTTFQLDFYARHRLSSLVDLALPYLSITGASIPLAPLGTLGLDPSQMIALEPVIIPAATGVGSLSFPVPNLTVLLGLPIYAQALMVPYPFPAHLTGTTFDIVTL